jgi:hypothetical protein
MVFSIPTAGLRPAAVDLGLPCTSGPLRPLPGHAAHGPGTPGEANQSNQI